MLPVWIESVPGALMIPPDDVNIHEKSIIEVLAPVRLKKELSLQDGDPVRISVRRTEG
jgi:CTP-dependent riboflavin kinase